MRQPKRDSFHDKCWTYIFSMYILYNSVHTQCSFKDGNSTGARKYTSHVALQRKKLIRHVTMPSAGPLLEHQALATMTVPAQTCSQKPLTQCHPLKISHSSSHFQTFSVVAKKDVFQHQVKLKSGGVYLIFIL